MSPGEGPPSAASGDDEALVAAAHGALQHAYGPYSGRRVGAALRARDGRVFTGCNVENASYGLTICAERSALFQAVSEGAREFEALAVACDAEAPMLPCGACRQVLAEFAAELRVVCAGEGVARRRFALSQLLPHAFGPGDLPGGART